MNRREFCQLVGGLGLAMLVPGKAYADHGGLEITNHTHHHLTVHGSKIYEHHTGQEWIEIGSLRPFESDTWWHLEDGRWTVNARNPEGHYFGPYEITVHERELAHITIG